MREENSVQMFGQREISGGNGIHTYLRRPQVGGERGREMREGRKAKNARKVGREGGREEGDDRFRGGRKQERASISIWKQEKLEIRGFDPINNRIKTTGTRSDHQ